MDRRVRSMFVCVISSIYSIATFCDNCGGNLYGVVVNTNPNSARQNRGMSAQRLTTRRRLQSRHHEPLPHCVPANSQSVNLDTLKWPG